LANCNESALAVAGRRPRNSSAFSQKTTRKNAAARKVRELGARNQMSDEELQRAFSPRCHSVIFEIHTARDILQTISNLTHHFHAAARFWRRERRIVRPPRRGRMKPTAVTKPPSKEFALGTAPGCSAKKSPARSAAVGLNILKVRQNFLRRGDAFCCSTNFFLSNDARNRANLGRAASSKQRQISGSLLDKVAERRSR